MGIPDIFFPQEGQRKQKPGNFFSEKQVCLLQMHIQHAQRPEKKVMHFNMMLGQSDKIARLNRASCKKIDKLLSKAGKI